jgi:hypothetical protein
MDQLLATIGQFVLQGGIAAALAFFVFRFLGEKWIEGKFQKNLENYRHEHAKELQRLRVEIDSSLDEIIRFQEKEFSMLSETWDALNDLFRSVHTLISPFQSYQDINRMSDKMASEYLDQFELLKSQKAEILASSNRSEKWVETYDYIRLNRAIKDYRKFSHIITRSSIFFDSATEDKLHNLRKKMNKSISSYEVGKESKDHKLGKMAWDSLNDEIEPEVNALKDDLREKFRALAKKRQQA